MSHTTRHRDGDDRVKRSYTSEHNEQDSLFRTYEHLHKQPRADSALLLLRKVASLVKPIMRKRSWHVGTLAEFLPSQQNLLGVNVNHGEKICLRLRYHRNPDLFLPLEEIVDTMLHELSHIVFGPHDSKFHKLWDGLRDEYEVLARKGYTGEGFLSEGRRLGGSGGGWTDTRMSQQEMRRLARAGAEKRKTQSTLSAGSGRKLGGSAPDQRQPGTDIREVIVNSIMRRNNNTGMINNGCASGTRDADRISDQASQHTFKTKAEEDDANDRAIAQALYELMEQEEMEKLMPQTRTNKESYFSDLSRSTGTDSSTGNSQPGLYNANNNSNAGPSNSNPSNGYNQPSEEEQLRWAMQESLSTISTVGLTANNPPPIPLSSKPVQTAANAPPTSTKRKQPPSPSTNRVSPSGIVDLTADTPPSHTPGLDLSNDTNTPRAAGGDHWSCQICTCINPLQYLACDACGSERPTMNSIPQAARGRSACNSTGDKTIPRPTHNGNIQNRPSQQPNTSRPAPSSSTLSKAPSLSKRKEPETLGWVCSRCGAFMEHLWWTCSACGNMKDNS